MAQKDKSSAPPWYLAIRQLSYSLDRKSKARCQKLEFIGTFLHNLWCKQPLHGVVLKGKHYYKFVYIRFRRCWILVFDADFGADFHFRFCDDLNFGGYFLLLRCFCSCVDLNFGACFAYLPDFYDLKMKKKSEKQLVLLI